MRPLCKAEAAEVYRIGNGTIPIQVNKTGDWRFSKPVKREKTSPCRAACPLHGDIAAWLNKVKKGEMAAAWQIISRSNPFPAITGHVCYHFCESKCSRGNYDEPLSIAELEKQVGLWRQNQFATKEPGVTQELPVRVAVVGSGPTGLACAYYLRLQGVQVDVLERENVAGGLLAWGIPEFRLPRPVLAAEIRILAQMGVSFHYGVELGKDVTVDTLQQEYDAVFLATGASREKKLNVPGEDLAGVSGALQYLRSLHLGEPVQRAKSVVVVGGGNAAIDAACCARLQGADVVVAYRRTREAMPAHAEEVRAAEEAGVQFLFEVTPQAILGTDGVEKIALVRTQAQRREKPVQVVEGSAFVLECELVLVAVGQEAAPQVVGAGVVVRADSLLNGKPGVFAGGDLATGPSTVAAAIAAGREGARAISGYLELRATVGEDAIFADLLNPAVAISQINYVNPFLFALQGRAERPEEEAERCLSCGQCNGCSVCWLFCPDLAVEQGEADCQVMLDYCKGCGICVRECPAGVLEMEVSTHE